MSGREEKERRRQERLAAEQAAQQSAERRKRLGIVGGVVLIAAIAVIVVLAVAGGGDGGGTSEADGGGNAAIPPQRVENLSEAVRASGCELTTHKIQGRGHTSEAVEYDTNPPTSGDHAPTASEDGIYDAGNPPDVEQSVHALEHGRINVQYRKGTPQPQVEQLETFASESVKGTEGYHTLLFENQTDMEPAVAAAAWGRSLTCPEINENTWDALRAFRRDRVDKGPEFIP